MKKIRGFGGRSYGGGKKRNPLEQMAKLQEELQRKMEEVQERLSGEAVEASAGGGAVRVKMRCDYRVEDVVIDEDLSDDVEMLRDLIVAAFNEALEMVERKRREISRELLGGLDLPGLGLEL